MLSFGASFEAGELCLAERLVEMGGRLCERWVEGKRQHIAG